VACEGRLAQLRKVRRPESPPQSCTRGESDLKGQHGFLGGREGREKGYRQKNGATEGLRKKKRRKKGQGAGGSGRVGKRSNKRQSLIRLFKGEKERACEQGGVKLTIFDDRRSRGG